MGGGRLDHALAHAVLSNEALWDRDLTALPHLVERVSGTLDAIDAGDLETVLRRVST